MMLEIMPKMQSTTINTTNYNNHLMEENMELKKMIMENYGRNVTNNINHNQTFNINIFLNEQCKDAMNLTEFLESIQLNLQDLMKIADDGQTIGMSNILIDKLTSMDVFKRPVHCSDIKKEIIYVKDEDKWELEDKERTKLRNALDLITRKIIQTLAGMNHHPDDYVKTVSELYKEPREDKKIISKLAKEVFVE